MPRPVFPGFGKRLRELFAARGIKNQSAFARAHAFTQGQITRWLHGSLPEREEDRERLASALGVSWQELLVGLPTRDGADGTPVVTSTADDDAVGQSIALLRANGRLDLVEHLVRQGAYLSELVKDVRDLSDRLGKVEVKMALPAPAQRPTRKPSVKQATGGRRTPRRRKGAAS